TCGERNCAMWAYICGNPAHACRGAPRRLSGRRVPRKGAAGDPRAPCAPRFPPLLTGWVGLRGVGSLLRDFPLAHAAMALAVSRGIPSFRPGSEISLQERRESIGKDSRLALAGHINAKY